MRKRPIPLQTTLLLSTLLWAGALWAQDMEVGNAATPPLTPATLIENIFFGQGVEVLSVDFQGSPASVGFFKNAADEVGLERGIVMTTGRAASEFVPGVGFMPGADGVGTQFASNDMGGGGFDADLAAIASGPLHDVTVFTITFVPQADTLRFRYVFASEEYPEFSCDQFNDVFGFFISGPGISGPFSNNGANIALVPGTSLPVSINNVHPANPLIPGCDPQLEQFYNDNAGLPLQPVYDGLLDVFTAEAVVVPCETYTIKLAIADVEDEIYDSGVFLEAKSFGTGRLQVEVLTPSFDATLAEGCSAGEFVFRLPRPTPTDYPLDYTLFGSAQNGNDYALIPPGLFIPAGDSVLRVPILPLEDGLTEGSETLFLDIQRDLCGRDTFQVTLIDNPLLPPALPADTTLCPGASLLLDGTLPVPEPPPSTFTNPNPLILSTHGVSFTSNILVSGVQPPEVGPGVIQSVCLSIEHLWVDDLDLFLIAPNGQFLELSTDNGSNCNDYSNTCFTPSAAFSIADALPLPFNCPDSMQAPFTGDFLPEGLWSDLYGAPTNGTWQLVVIDDQQGINGRLVEWSISFQSPYRLSYQWSPAQGLSCTTCPDPTATPSASTTYHLQVSDTYGCLLEDSVHLELGPATPEPQVFCSNVSNGSITFGWDDVGAPAYEVNVDGQGWTNPNGGLLSHTVSGLLPGQSVSIEVRPLGTCAGATGSTTCQTPTCNAPTLTLLSQTDVSCPGAADGSFQVEAAGGAGPTFTYQVLGVQNQVGLFTDLAAGVYTVLVSDAAGCSNAIQVAVGEPDSLHSQPAILAPISCNGAADGSLTFAVQGGTPPYGFQWSNGASDSVLTGLAAGTYTATITDARGCQRTDTLSLSEPPPLQASATTLPATCQGASDGSALVTPAGGTPPYQYQWDAAAQNQTTAQALNLPAGTYAVTVRDANGCQHTLQATVGEPDSLQLTFLFTPPTCPNDADGSAEAQVLGGVPPYAYLWSTGAASPQIDMLPGGTYTLTVTDANGCQRIDSLNLPAPEPLLITLSKTDLSCFEAQDGRIQASLSGGTPPLNLLWNTGADSSTLQNLAAGTYCLVVTDANGCTASACETLSQPAALGFAFNLTPASCNGGSDGAIDLTPSGGTPPYQYLWSSGHTTEDLNDLPAGTYALQMTDANGCTADTTLNLPENSSLSLQANPSPPSCTDANDGSIDLQVNGGTPPFTYLWSGPNGFSSPLEDPTALSGGTYSVSVVDATACSATLAVELIVPPPLTLAFQPVDSICFGATNGSATALPDGGSPPYQFLWDSGETEALAQNLSPGWHTLTLSDSRGCDTLGQVFVPARDSFYLALEQDSASCHGIPDGRARIVGAFYGTLPAPLDALTLQWAPVGGNGLEASGLSGGQTYSVSATDDLGCTAEASIRVEEPAPLEVLLLQQVHPNCAGSASGLLEVAAQGGTPPYQFQWSPSAGAQTTPLAQDLPAGTHEVSVTDGHGCQSTAAFTLQNGEPMQLAFSTEAVSCHSGQDGRARVEVSGGLPPYTLLWSTGSTQSEIQGLAAGFYLISVTDARGCLVVDSVRVEQPEAPLSLEVEVQPVSCFGASDGAVFLEGSGGTPPYAYSLDGENFGASSAFLALEPGTYAPTIRDARGCLFEGNLLLLEEPEPLVVDAGPDTSVYFGGRVQMHPLVSPPDTAGRYTYLWTAEDPNTLFQQAHFPNPFVSPEVTTWLTLTVTDAQGCRASDRLLLQVRKTRTVLVPTGFSPNGDGRNDLLLVHGNSKIVERIERFRVFDRWGEMLYEALDFEVNDPLTGWDGRFRGQDMPAGVYAWVLEVSYRDGFRQTLTGHTTLIR